MPDMYHRASIPSGVIPDIFHRESISSSFLMDPRYLPAGITKKRGHDPSKNNSEDHETFQK